MQAWINLSVFQNNMKL